MNREHIVTVRFGILISNYWRNKKTQLVLIRWDTFLCLTWLASCHILTLSHYKQIYVLFFQSGTNIQSTIWRNSLNSVPILIRPYLMTNLVNMNLRGTEIFSLKFEQCVTNKTRRFTTVRFCCSASSLNCLLGPLMAAVMQQF